MLLLVLKLSFKNLIYNLKDLKVLENCFRCPDEQTGFETWKYE